MITGIVLENFKCFERVEIHPKRVTCFVGANGTGKSSVLQAFGLLKQSTVKRSILQIGNIVDYSIEVQSQGPLLNINSPKELSLKLGQSSFEISFEGTRKVGGKERPFSFHSELEDYSDIETDLSGDRSFTNIRWTLRSLTIVPALRGFTLPAYRLGDNVSADVAMEQGFANQEAQTATNLGYLRPDIEKISPLLQRVSGVGLRVDTVPPQSVEVKSTTSTRSFNIVSEGFGTNSLIMLLLQLTSADRGATVMIEEPEIHLHPKAQAEMAEVLVEVALEEDKQVIMTTHSEHITGRLLTLVAEGKLTPDDVAIYAFEKDEQGVCTAKNLRINPDGTMEGAVNDFFEVNLAEMNRFAQAQFSRLRSEE